LEQAHDGAPEAGAAQLKSDDWPDAYTLGGMTRRSPLDELRERFAGALRGAPAPDLQKNLDALLVAFFDRFDLAARQDLELHKKLLERAQAKLAALETRVAELEARKPPA
jgi:BMFP domain-containing protein YqiC